MASPVTQEGYMIDSEDYPKAWVFGKPGISVGKGKTKLIADGESVSGNFVRFALGFTRDYGEKPIAILNVGGEERSLWLAQTVLYGKFRDELLRRPDHRLEPGERVEIRRQGKVESEAAMGSYWSFSVRFPDRPELSTRDLFGLGDEQSDEEPGDEIPY
jgi:hypothetical protein